MRGKVRLLCLVMALLLCLNMAACGEKAENKNSAGEKTQNTDSGNQGDTPGNAEGNNQQSGEQIKKPQTPEEFFKNAAFIGDSVTLKLRYYDAENKCLHGATFLCQGSYSVAHAVNNSMYLSYRGEDVTPQDALKTCGADKVFILLGMNDIALWGIDKTMDNWETLVTNIRSTCPNIEIYIQSGTPIYLDGEVGGLTNANMDAYNLRLQEFAQEQGCHYVDVNTPFRNSSGGLAEAYCSDDFVHFTDAACKLWVEILMEQV